MDSANARFRIEEEGGEPCFWVVGGSYCDTKFDEPAAGGGEEWYGPFRGLQRRQDGVVAPLLVQRR